MVMRLTMQIMFLMMTIICIIKRYVHNICILKEYKNTTFCGNFKFFQIFFKKPLDFLVIKKYNVVQEKGGEHLCAKMGRPKSENPKGTQLGVRLDDETLAKVDEMAKAHSLTRVQVIRQGIECLYRHVKK